MATTPQQLFVRSRLSQVPMAIDTTVASGVINSGDMVYVTAAYGAASLSTPGATNANAANFIGVSRSTYPIPVANGIAESGSAGNFPTVTTAPTILVDVEGDFQFKTTNGDTYHPFDSVYLGADGQTVQKTASGTSLGTVSPNQTEVGGTVGGNIAGTGTNYVVIHIKPAVS